MNDVENLMEQLADDGPARGAAPVFDGATRRAARHRKVRTRRRILSGAGGVVALVVVVALVAQMSTSKSDSNGIRVAGNATTIPSTPVIVGATAAQLAAGHWSVVPAAPISPRSDASVVWTGEELLVWGGQSGGNAASKSDGAAYNPSTRTWRLLPDSPVSGTGGQAAVWTGSEMVVVRGAAAAYRPASNSWRTLPAVPLPAAGTVVSVWTGSRVVVFAGTDVAAYDPGADTWQRLPSIPTHRKPGWEVQQGYVTAAVAAEPGVVFAWSEWAAQRPFGVNGTEGTGGSEMLRYESSTNRWTVKASGHAAITSPEEAFWAGGRSLVRGDMHIPNATGPGPLPEASAWYDADTGRATRLPPDALTAGPDAVGHLSSAWTGSALWSLNTEELAGNIRPGDASVYDPVANAWQRIGSAPFGCKSPSEPVWTGTSVFVYCPLTYQSHLHPGGPVGGLEYDVG